MGFEKLIATRMPLKKETTLMKMNLLKTSSYKIWKKMNLLKTLTFKRWKKMSW